MKNLENKDAVISSPSKFFDEAIDVLADKRFTRLEKIKILKNWKQFYEQVLKSESEGLRGIEITGHLQDVCHALRLLHH